MDNKNNPNDVLEAHRLPRWPASDTSPAGVIDSVRNEGLSGWIIDPERPHAAIEFQVVCNGHVLAFGRTNRPRFDVTAILSCGYNPGYFVSWSQFDVSTLSRLLRSDPDASIEVFVPELNAILSKYEVGTLAIAEIAHFFPQWNSEENILQPPGVKIDDFESIEGFYRVGLPSACISVDSKRICLVTTEFHGLFKNGGIGTANTGLAIELAQAGWDVSVLFIDCDDQGPRTRAEPFADVAARYKTMGITLDYLPRYSEIFEQFRDIRRVSFAIYKYVSDKRYGAIYFNECGGQGFYTIMAARAGALSGNTKVVVVTHGPNDWTHDLNSQQWAHSQLVVLSYMEKKCVEYADVVVSPSEYLLHWMKARNWKLPRSLFVEQNIVSVVGRDTAPADADDAVQPIAELVFFGRQEVRKGVVLFCDSLDKLVASGVSLAGITVTFLGKIWRIGAMNSAAYILLRSAKWGAKVRFLASLGQNEANAYLAGAGRLAIIPSLAENSPCVIAECLQLNVPFVATSTGGTAELVEPADRANCLVAAEPGALAERIAICLKSGQRSSRMAIDQRITRQRWRDFMRLSEAATTNLETAPFRRSTALSSLDDRSPTATDKPLVSVCLVHYERPSFLRQAFESILTQNYPTIELVIVDDGSREPATLNYLEFLESCSWPIPVKIIRQRNKYLGAARNNGARNSSGEYILFVDDDNLLLPDAVSDFVRAAEGFGADIVTGVPYSFYHRQQPNAEFDGEIRTLPLGGCVEVGFFENCYGDANALVSRRAHELVGGFHEIHGAAVEDWEFFAKASLNGLKVEVLPKPTFWYRVLESGMFVRSDPVANARRIANAYYDQPIRNVSRMLELFWEINREQRFRMLQMAAQNGDASDTLVKLTDADPESKESKRLLLQYMVEQRRVQEALDFALHNDIALIEHVTVAARDQTTRDAREELDRYHAVVNTTLDITEQVIARADVLYGAEHGLIRTGGRTAFTVSFDTAVVRAEEVCPTGAEAVTARCAASGNFKGYEVCLIVCAAGVTGDIDTITLGLQPGVYTSGWLKANPENDLQFRTLLRGPDIGGPHHVFLVARPLADATGVCELSWYDFTVEMGRTGSAGKSLIRPRFTPRRLSERIVVERGRPITRAAVPQDFEWFVPGYPTTLHPIHGELAVMRVARIIPPGALGARITVSVVNDKAHPIQFGLWMHPTSDPLEDETHVDRAAFFSGWVSVVEKNVNKPLQLNVSEPVDEPHDLYVASRVAGQPNVWYCHALVHDIYVLLDTSN